MRSPIAVIVGGSIYADVMLDAYINEFGRAGVRVIREQPAPLPRLWSFFKRRVRNRGIFSALDAVACRVAMAIDAPAVKLASVQPDLVTKDVNDPSVVDFIREQGVGLVVLSVCSLLSAAQLSRFHVPVLNVHNGINPRYRGAGNIWALAEDRPSTVGVTVHLVDSGVDTGQPVAVELFNPVEEGIPFCQVDLEAFLRGAKLAIAYVRSGQGGVPPECSGLVDRYYPFPGLSTWLRARRQLKRQSRREEADVSDQTWLKSFREKAGNQSLDIPARLHWSDGTSVIWRDAAVLQAVQNRIGSNGRVLDVGCGDARLAGQLGEQYVGCDYSEATLMLAPDHVRRVVGAADALSFASGSFDATLAIGLMQHVNGAQSVADELFRVTRSGGIIVLNTLRQFSRLELAVIAACSVFNPMRLSLVQAIWRREHSVLRGGELVGRRYTVRELRRLFPRRAKLLSAVYHGMMGLPLFAREITLCLELHNQGQNGAAVRNGAA